MNFLEKIGKVVIATPFVIGLIILTSVYMAFAEGFVSLTLYNWFVIPHFKELPTFNVWQFAGFSLFFSAVLPTTTLGPDIKKEFLEDNASLLHFIKGLSKPWILLFIAYIVKVFISW